MSLSARNKISARGGQVELERREEGKNEQKPIVKCPQGPRYENLEEGSASRQVSQESRTGGWRNLGWPGIDSK